MPITAQVPPSAAPWVSIRMPASLLPSLSRSFGHFSCTGTSCAASASASATPTASGRPSRRCGEPANFHASEKVSESPAADSQLRPARPRPALWCSATSRVGRAQLRRARHQVGVGRAGFGHHLDVDGGAAAARRWRPRSWRRSRAACAARARTPGRRRRSAARAAAWRPRPSATGSRGSCRRRRSRRRPFAAKRAAGIRNGIG